MLAAEGKQPDQIHDALISDDVYESIRDPKMARNIVEKVARKKRGDGSLKSLADQISRVQKMYEDKKYQKWFHNYNWTPERRLPSMTLYTDEFLTDVARLSKGRTPVVLGVDKTFELSSMYCTLLTYR